MKVEFRTSFERDLRKISQKAVKAQVRAIIEKVEQADSFQQIEDLKKLRGTENYYRIKSGDYRIGVVIQEDRVIFVRFLHRKDIYRYFP